MSLPRMGEGQKPFRSDADFRNVDKYEVFWVINLMVGEAGLEPTTPGLEGRCSIQLSYSPTLFYCSVDCAGPRVTVDSMESAKTANTVSS